MVTLDGLAAGVKARFATANPGSADFQTACPGGAWFARADEQAAAPYLVFTLDPDGDPQRQTDGSMLQKWTLQTGVYTDQGRSGHAPAAVQAAVNKCLPVTGWAALASGVVVHCLPRAPRGEFSPKARGGKDVFLSRGSWQLLVAGDSTP